MKMVRHESIGKNVDGMRCKANQPDGLIFNGLIFILYGSKLTDMETGYKLLPASFLKTAVLSGNRFEIEPEITVKLIRNNIPIFEVPISYKGRNRLAGKKLTIRDALEALKTLIYNKFNSLFG